MLHFQLSHSIGWRSVLLPSGPTKQNALENIYWKTVINNSAFASWMQNDVSCLCILNNMSKIWSNAVFKIIISYSSVKDLQVKTLHSRNSPTTHFPTLSTVPLPLKCDWNCAVWISSSGVCVCLCVSDSKLKEKLDLFLTVFWSLDWKWDSLLTLKVHLNLTCYSREISRQWVFFFSHMTKTFPHGIRFDVWVADSTRISARDTVHFCAYVFVLIQAGNLLASY